MECAFQGHNGRKERKTQEFSRPPFPFPAPHLTFSHRSELTPRRRLLTATCVCVCVAEEKRESRGQVLTASQLTSVRSESGAPPSTLVNQCSDPFLRSEGTRCNFCLYRCSVTFLTPFLAGSCLKNQVSPFFKITLQSSLKSTDERNQRNVAKAE